MFVVGIDPGNVTGIAWYDTFTKITPFTWEIDAVNVGSWMREQAASWPKSSVIHVMGERYTMTPGIKTSQPAALEVMGVMKDQCVMLGWTLDWTSPRTSKKTTSDTLLRQMGWYRKTKDGHANDGCRLVIAGLLAYDQEEYARLTGI